MQLKDFEEIIDNITLIHDNFLTYPVLFFISYVLNLNIVIITN